MAQPSRPGNMFWPLGWDLGISSNWEDSELVRLCGSFSLGWFVAILILGHPSVHSRWPWTAATSFTAGVVFVMGLVLWGYWRLIRRIRKTLVPALRGGEKVRFRSATRFEKRLLMLVGGGTGFLASHYDWPLELLLLFYVPWIIISGVETLKAYREAARLSLDLREVALRSKLAPHFIFNTLNTLHAQIATDPRGAEATTEKLAVLFRQMLEVSNVAMIPLQRELNFIELHLGIEQARLGERLQVAIAVPEELESAEIPPLSLQVLVENAIKHGVAPLESGGEIRIGAEQRDGFLWLWVEDPGTGASPEKGTGTALETLRQRLEKPEDLEMGVVGGRHRVSFRWRQP